MPVDIVAAVVRDLAPAAPFLLGLGGKAAEGAAKKLGEGVWTRAQTLWSRLRPKVEATPSALEALRDVASAPGDEDSQAALRVQIKKLLAEDPTLAEDVRQIVSTNAAGVQVNARGKRAVAVGGNAGTIITGNRNRVERQRD